MIRVENLKSVSEKKFFEVFDSWGDIYRSKFIQDPLSEFDILDLQEKFLSNGIHHITVQNVQFGRELVYRFLNSINCYHENAVLSLCPQASNYFCSQVDTLFSDIYYDLLQGGYTDENKNLGFNDFFVEQFYYDFMFIEASQDLLDSSWFLKFFSSIKNNEIDQHMPILVMTYNK